MTRLYSVDEVAERFGVHHQTVRKLVREGKLDWVPVGRKKKFTEEAIEDYIARHTVTGPVAVD